jgi:hypothetical protein
MPPLHQREKNELSAMLASTADSYRLQEPGHGPAGRDRPRDGSQGRLRFEAGTAVTGPEPAARHGL